LRYKIILIVMGVLTIIGVRGHGLGYTIPALTEEEAINGDPPVEVLADKMEYSILMIQCLQIGFAKLSILFFYRRIFCCSIYWSSMSIMTGFLILITVVWSIAFFFVNLFECGTNFTLNWQASAAQAADCINEQLMNQAYIYSDFILDVLIFIMPMHQGWETSNVSSAPTCRNNCPFTRCSHYCGLSYQDSDYRGDL